MGIPDYHMGLLRNLYARQEATVEIRHGTMDWVKLQKELVKVIYSHRLFNLNAEYNIWNAGLDEEQVGIKISGRNINNLRYADDTNLMAESKEWKSFLMIMKEKRETLAIAQHSKYKGRGIWSHHFVANILGKNGNSDRPYFIGLQNHCKWWLQPWNQKTLASWEKNYDKLRQHIKKERHYFANKGPSSQSYGFSNSHVWMWELDYKESWV